MSIRLVSALLAAFAVLSLGPTASALAVQRNHATAGALAGQGNHAAASALAGQGDHATASALAVQGDAATTREYIQANYRLVQLTASKIGPIEATLRGVRGQILRECPKAAAGSPQNTASEQLSNEVIGAMVTASVHLVEAPASREYIRTVERLSWSDRSLTRAVRAYANKALALVALAPPKLCADVSSWAASGFQTLPASTATFAPHFITVWIAPGELPPALAQYETPAERPLLSRTNQLERKFTEMEARAVNTWGEIMDGLGLHP